MVKVRSLESVPFLRYFCFYVYVTSGPSLLDSMIEGSTVKQKLENKQNMSRDDISETRVVVEMAVTSEQVNKRPQKLDYTMSWKLNPVKSL